MGLTCLGVVVTACLTEVIRGYRKSPARASGRVREGDDEDVEEERTCDMSELFPTPGSAYKKCPRRCGMPG